MSSRFLEMASCNGVSPSESWNVHNEKHFKPWPSFIIEGVLMKTIVGGCSTIRNRRQSYDNMKGLEKVLKY